MHLRHLKGDVALYFVEVTKLLMLQLNKIST